MCLGAKTTSEDTRVVSSARFFFLFLSRPFPFLSCSPDLSGFSEQSLQSQSASKVDSCAAKVSRRESFH